MPIIAGLGNPGSKYDETRHNIGFRIIDTLAQQHNVSFKAGKGSYYIGKAVIKGTSVILVLPTTYMNLSGDAIQHAMHYFDVPLDDVIVCTDDINLPVGKIRLRPGGSAGGHNGLKDIILKTGSDQFPRLKFGVGDSFRSGRQADYVLSRFNKAEKPIVEDMITASVLAVEEFLTNGIQSAMNKFN
jgi:PTH1 family peptidyl-tRNA hydrolase